MICPKCLEKKRDCTCLLGVGDIPIRFPDDTVIVAKPKACGPSTSAAFATFTDETLRAVCAGYYDPKLAGLDNLLREVRSELLSAMAKHAPMATTHHGYAVIKEELEELWDEIKRDRGRETMAREEALQVAAMALRYVLDLTDSPEA